MAIVGVVREEYAASGSINCAYVGVVPNASNDQAARGGMGVPVGEGELPREADGESVEGAVPAPVDVCDPDTELVGVGVIDTGVGVGERESRVADAVLDLVRLAVTDGVCEAVPVTDPVVEATTFVGVFVAVEVCVELLEGSREGQNTRSAKSA